MAETTIISRKIELLVNEDQKEAFIEKWKLLRKMSDDTFKAANRIMTHQHFNDNFAERIVISDEDLNSKRQKIDKKLEDINAEIKEEKDESKIDKLKVEKSKLYKKRDGPTREAREKAVEFYTCSEQNTTYQLLGNEFPDLPSTVVSTLNSQVVSKYKKESFDVKRGKRSLSTFKKDMPIPFSKKSMRFREESDVVYMDWVRDISFKLNFGKDRSGNRLIVQRAMSGDYKYCDSSIQIDGKKIFLSFVVHFPKIENKLDDTVSIGVDLGLTVPACCASTNDKYAKFISSKEEFLSHRLQIQNRRRDLQKRLSLVVGGKGRGKKLKALETIKEKERNYAKSQNHMISAGIIKYARDKCAKFIKLEFLEGFMEEEKNNFVLRNWSYFELQTMTEQKAEKNGMIVMYVDPYHTSQTCACCGHFEDGQRLTQSKFVCKNVDCSNKDEKTGENKTMNADFNAALNIAKSTKIVTKKEDCEYYKLHKLKLSSVL